MVTQNQKIQFIMDHSAPSVTSSTLISMLDSLINHYTLEKLSIWETDHTADTREFDNKLAALKNQKQELQQMISAAHSEGLKLEIKVAQ